jgi:hypothetical protein
LVFGDDLPNFDQRNIFGRMALLLNGALKVSGESGRNLISSSDLSNRGLGSSRGFTANNNFGSNSGLLSSSRRRLLSDFRSNI